MKFESPKQIDAIDPVCGMRVDPQNTSAWSYHSGEKIYFCAQGCKEIFESNPKRYLKKDFKRKGFWQRYLHRLNKATGGKPPECH